MQVINNSVVVPAKMISNQDWITAPNLPANLSEHQTIAWRSYAYLVGGYDGTNISSSVYKANILTNGNAAWETQNSLPEGIRNAAIVATPTKLYVLGGRNSSGPSNKVYFANLNDDGSVGAWSLASITLPQALQGHKAQYINGYVYIIGGTNQTNVNTALNTVYYAKVDMDGIISGFTSTTSLPETRNAHSMVNYDNKIYIIGGYDNSNIRKKTVYYSSINNDGTCSSWLSATSLPYAISNHSSTCSHGIVTVIGGEDSILVTNTFYYANIDASPTLTWTLSSNYLYDRSMNGSVYEAPGQIVFSGGVNLSGNPISSNRYIFFNLDVNKVKRSSFVSAPFVIGTPKNIQQLYYNLTSTPTTDSVQLYYRLAGIDKIWGSWISGGKTDPVVVNQSKSYIQYMVKFFANSSNNLSFDDLTLTVSGYTQLCGNLNYIDTLRVANSPYWATCDIQFTADTHYIQPGVKIEFWPGTMMEIGAASMTFNGTAANPIILTSDDTLRSHWNGLYFDQNSNPYSSVLNYTNISFAGSGSLNADLYCYNSNQPNLNNCSISNSLGHGIRLEYSNLNISNTTITNNAINGIYMYASSPAFSYMNTTNNGFAGLYYATNGLTPTYSHSISGYNLYGIYSPTPDNSFAPANPATLVLNNNVSDIALEGGSISTSRTWSFFPKGIALLGDVTVANGGGVRLTIAPGLTIKVANNKGIYVGGSSTIGGEIYATGKPDSIITFTALDGTIGGWNGFYFNDGSDYGSTSSLRYCIIEKGNDHNIYSYNSNEPHILFSTIRNSVNYGIRSEYSNLSIEESSIRNSNIGIYLYSSSPSLVLDTIDGITNYGIEYANDNSLPTFFSIIIQNSGYGIYYSQPDRDIPTITNVNFINLKCAIAIDGGAISSDRFWSYNKYSYAILNNVTVGVYNSKCRLTLAPGNTFKFAKNVQLEIGNYYCPYYCYSYGGELFAEGKQDSLIKFTALNDSIGGWNGVYFNDNSDNFGSTSSIKYCTFEKGNQYNVWCDNTNQPTFTNCSFINSANMGLYASVSPLNISNCVINNNGGMGINAYNSLLTINNLTFNNNGSYGLFYNDAYYLDNLLNVHFTGNTYDGVVIGGGTISENRTWNYLYGKNYTILNSIIVARQNDTCRLTIKPGNTIKFAKNAQLQIGNRLCPYYCYFYGGELYAEGKSDSIISFTALNDSIGGWNGLYFNDYSDEFGNTSSLKYCLIEKGNQYNIWCDNTSQPVISNCTINSATNMGLNLTTSPISISNSVINNNGGIGINSFNSLLNLSNLTVHNNGSYGLYYNDAYYLDNLVNIQFSGNIYDGAVIGGGTISENRLWNSLGGKTYTILGNIIVGKYLDKNRLTIKPGNIIRFAKNTGMQIGNYLCPYYCYGYGAEIYAEGKHDSLIIFTALNDSIGGWNGLYFHNYSNSSLYGCSSSLKYCTIQKSSQYNIWCDQTDQPKIDSCTIQYSADMGVFANLSTNSISNTSIKNNGGIGINAINSLLKLSNLTINNNTNYGLYFNDAYYIDNLVNLKFSGNKNDGVVVNGGSISENRLWNSLNGKPYTILGSILIAKNSDKSRLTIKPGCTLLFAKNTNIQIGNYTCPYYCYNWGGELFAEGTSDSLINFIPLNDSIGGWNGLYFHYNSNVYGSRSSLKYCTISKGNQYNIYCNSTSQPTINKSIIDKSAGYGIWLDGTSDTLRNTKIANNNGYGVYLTNGSSPSIGNDVNSTCDIYNNYGYNVYNNSSTSFTMSYNFLGSMDSSYVESKIFDYVDNNSLGMVYYSPISHLPSQFAKTNVLYGKLLYDNNPAKPIKHATLRVKDYLNNIVSTTITNSDGSYTINHDSVNVFNRIEIVPLDLLSSVNSTDALQILLHFTHQITLTGHHSFVADVNNSRTINGTDAMLILKRSIGQISSFNSGDVALSCDSVILTNDSINYQLSMLWFGDVNGSYIPTNNKSFADINLITEGSIKSLNNDEFLIPIKIKNNLSSVGAISLAFNIPEDLIEITGVKLKSSNEDLLFSVNNGVLKTGWYKLDAITLNNNDELLIVKAKIRGSNYNEPITFEINSESEFADAWANKLGNLTLSMPKINSKQETTIVNPVLEPNFPNPVNGKTEFIYNVDEQGMVNLSIYNMLGQKVADLVNQNMMPGKYSKVYDASNLKKGVYLYRISINTSNGIKTDERKMIVE